MPDYGFCVSSADENAVGFQGREYIKTHSKTDLIIVCQQDCVGSRALYSRAAHSTNASRLRTISSASGNTGTNTDRTKGPFQASNKVIFTLKIKYITCSYTWITTTTFTERQPVYTLCRPEKKRTMFRASARSE